MTRVIIAGGGLSGGLAAIALATQRPDLDLLLFEQAETIGGNHIWSFFDGDIAPEDRWVIEKVKANRWPDHEVRFPERSRVVPTGYNSVRSPDLELAVRSGLPSEQIRLGQTIASVGADFVKLADGRRVEADCVIDARGPEPMSGLDLGWQKFVGRLYRFSKPHGLKRPVVMDATVEQSDGYRFVYYLPFTATEVLVEDTYYSLSSDLDREVIGERLSLAAGQLGSHAKVEGEESGVLPLVIAGEIEALWPEGNHIPQLGLRGGFFHPTTGYSLPDAVANAAWLAGQTNFETARLGKALRQRAERLWRERRFFRLLNRMLFRAAEPDESYRVLQHFYRLPPARIGRFYGARLTATDKFRILSGRPPIPIGRAISALWRNAE